MSEIIFRGARIQTGFRIKIPKPLIDTLELKSGDKIIIRYNVDKKEIIIQSDRERQKKKK